MCAPFVSSVLIAFPLYSLCALPRYIFRHMYVYTYICTASVCMHVGVYASRHRSAVRGVPHSHYSQAKMLANSGSLHDYALMIQAPN